MRYIIRMLWIVFILFGLFACSSSEVKITDQSDKLDTGFLLGESGLYFFGVTKYQVIDESRGGRQIKVVIWYPANEETDELSMWDASANKNDGPYPLVITGADTGNDLFKSYLATHGFVMASVHSPIKSTYRWDYDHIDNARDFIFVLDQLASNPPDGLKGIIDTDRVGVVGYSGEGNTSLAVSGVRVDPKFYRSQCEQVPFLYPGVWNWDKYACILIDNWDEFASNIGDDIATTDDSMWKAITDERIKAVVSMSAAAPWLFGDQGLAATDKPIFLVSPTEDEYDPHEMVTYIYEHLGSKYKYMITFVGKSHMMVYQSETAKRLKHFVSAFFGYYLQGRNEYASYFSEEFVAQFDDLAWGIYLED